MSEENKLNQSDNSETFEDASDSTDVLKKSNKEIIDEIIEKQSSSHLNHGTLPLSIMMIKILLMITKKRIFESVLNFC